MRRISAASGPRRLFGGAAYYLFCPKCGAYLRAALIRVNMVLQPCLTEKNRQKNLLYFTPLVYLRLSLEHFRNELRYQVMSTIMS